MRGKVCVVFDFAKLRQHLNSGLAADRAYLNFEGVPFDQVLAVNYGVVQYVDWDRHQANEAHLANPVRYTFLKALRFNAEKELRIAVSAPGLPAGFRLK